MLQGAYNIWCQQCKLEEADGLASQLGSLMTCNPFVAFMAANAGFHFCWVATLTVCQLYQIVILAMTTNERMNAGRYKHFHIDGKIKSPFHRGIVKNAVDFCGWRCGGIFRVANSNEWYRRYETHDSGDAEAKALLLV